MRELYERKDPQKTDAENLQHNGEAVEVFMAAAMRQPGAAPQGPTMQPSPLVDTAANAVAQLADAEVPAPQQPAAAAASAEENAAPPLPAGLSSTQRRRLAMGKACIVPTVRSTMRQTLWPDKQ